MLPTGEPQPPAATLTFLCLLLLGFAWQLLAVPGTFIVPAGFAFVPGNLFGGAGAPPAVPAMPPPATLVTYLFFHAGWLHLLGNLLFLWVFGPRVEETLGPGRWTVLLLACGIAAGLVQAWPEPSSAIGMVGASGAISGLLGAWLYFHPRETLPFAVPFLPGMRPPAWLALIAWFGLQLLYANWTETVPGGTAFRAHVGGFACGLLLSPVLHFLGLLSADARAVARTLRSRDSSH